MRDASPRPMRNNERTHECEEGNVLVEARYTSGPGVLIGSGAHWVLVTDPGDEDVLDRLWEIVSTPRLPGMPVLERVLALVESEVGPGLDGSPPALAAVDLTPGASTTTTLGAGRVRETGQTHVLTLGGAADRAPTRRRQLVAGVVAAADAVLHPLSSPGAGATARPVAQAVAAPPAPTAGLIDGIPPEILAATGPEGPPPPRPRHQDRQWVSAQDTGSSVDTTEPDPLFVERIEEGAHTTIRAPLGDAAAPDDHDGSTVHRPAHLTPATATTVLAVSCPLGHLTPPTDPACRTCHQRVAPQEPRRVQRPTLGGLRLPTGEVVPLDRGVVLGRKPAPVEGSTDWPHLVHLPPAHSFVSRMHLHVELDGWDVVARDLDSRGGTTLAQPGREPLRMSPGEAYVLEPGAVLDLAEVYAVRFETGPVAAR